MARTSDRSERIGLAGAASNQSGRSDCGKFISASLPGIVSGPADAAGRGMDGLFYRLRAASMRSGAARQPMALAYLLQPDHLSRDRKSTRLNSSHLVISYAVFCLKKKKT